MQNKVLRNSLQPSFAKPSLDSHLPWHPPDEEIHNETAEIDESSERSIETRDLKVLNEQGEQNA